VRFAFVFRILTIGVGLATEPVPQVLLLKNGSKINYDTLSKEGDMVILRSGGSTVFLSASEVQPAEDPKPAKDAAWEAKAAQNKAFRWIGESADKHNVRPELVQAIVEVESAFKTDARSHAGAIGLMQLMPQTARHLRANPHDPEQNVEAGTRYLDMLLKKYESRPNGLALALAAYNAGPGAVDRWRGIPPYKETRDYVRKVIRRYKQLVQN